MPKVIKRAWENAFAPSVNLKAWSSFGFNTDVKGIDRRVHWQLLQEEEARQKRLDKAGVKGIKLDCSRLQFKSEREAKDTAKSVSEGGGVDGDSDSGDDGDEPSGNGWDTKLKNTNLTRITSNVTSLNLTFCSQMLFTSL